MILDLQCLILWLLGIHMNMHDSFFLIFESSIGGHAVHQFLSQYFPMRNFERFRNNILEGLDSMYTQVTSGIIEPTKIVLENIRLISACVIDELGEYRDLGISLQLLDTILESLRPLSVLSFDMRIKTIKIKDLYSQFLDWMQASIKSNSFKNIKFLYLTIF
jgi:hypothetical protein